MIEAKQVTPQSFNMESLEIIVNSQKAINDCCDARREDV